MHPKRAGSTQTTFRKHTHHLPRTRSECKSTPKAHQIHAKSTLNARRTRRTHAKRAGNTQTTFPRTRLDAECKKRRDLRPVAAIEVVNFPGLIPSRTSSIVVPCLV